MKNVKDYNSFIHKYEYPCDEHLTFESFMESNGVDDDTITEDMMDWYAYHICDKTGFDYPYWFEGGVTSQSTYVTEMLNKTSVDLLVKTLKRELGSRSYFITCGKGKDDEHINTIYISPEIYDREKIIDVCDRMMWIFTVIKTGEDRWESSMSDSTPYIDYFDDIPVYSIAVEPVKSKVITDFVKTNCGGKIYHICPKENVGDILKSGLRVKGDKNSYRYINNRLYFVCGKTLEELKENILVVARSKRILKNGWLDDRWSILEIDVKDYNIDFYQDGMYEDDVRYIGYTYNYFPPKRLRIVDGNEFGEG